MKITFDPTVGMLYVHKAGTVGVKAQTTRMLYPGVMADFDSSNRLIGLEIWGDPAFELEVLR